jgi:Arc/MetJ-type ribon-helix-helix transcriptional regulator
MTINLPKDVESSINAEVVSGHFASADEAIAEAWRQYLKCRQREATTATPAASHEALAPPCKPIWEEIEEITAGVPDEEFLKLPIDGAEQHDHYIYGLPKRPAQT